MIKFHPLKSLQDVTPADVLKVYDGEPGCMCGCLGKYFVTPASREAAGKWRGYPYDDEDVSESDVLRVLRLVQSAGDRVEVGAEYYYVEIDSVGLIVCTWHQEPNGPPSAPAPRSRPCDC